MAVSAMELESTFRDLTGPTLSLLGRRSKGHELRMAKRQSRQQPSSLKFRIGPLLAVDLSPQGIVKLVFTRVVTSLEAMVGKQVVRAMERSEAGTCVYLRLINVPPDVFLPHQNHSLSKVLQTSLSQSSSFPFSLSFLFP